MIFIQLRGSTYAGMAVEKSYTEGLTTSGIHLQKNWFNIPNIISNFKKQGGQLAPE